MKRLADYSWCGGPVVEYDDEAPCWYCELPVDSASMSGTVVCPACDCGRNRDGSNWNLEQVHRYYANYKRNAALADMPVVGGVC